MEEKYDLGNNSLIIYGSLPTNIVYDFEELWNLHPNELGKLIIYGKEINAPRWFQNYIKNYFYTGVIHQGIELPHQFKQFLNWANSLNYGIFNQVLVNWYQNGHHYIGKHSDNEPIIKKNSAIMSISLGAKRIFRIRDKKTNIIVKDIEMNNNSYIIMIGEMQKYFTHEVPKINGKKGEQIGKRINITMRQFI